jgi:hypothetical protein
MATPTDGTMTKKGFVKRALKTEHQNQIKRAAEKQKAQDAARGLRKINGRVYRLALTDRSRSRVEAEAGTRTEMTSIQRVPDGWGLYVLTDESPSLFASLTARFRAKEEPDGAGPAD